MASLSILQVAVSGRAVRERIDGKVAQDLSPPARLARELGLVLTRARTSLTHGVGVIEGAVQAAAGDARLEQVLALEASRTSPRTHADDGVCVITLVALGPAPLFGAVAPGDARALEGALQSLGAAPDAAVTRLGVQVAPAAGEAFDLGALAEGYPHLGALGAGTAGGQARCRFCGQSFEAYRTSCPSCGGVVDR